MRDAAQEIPGGSQGASWLCSLYGVMEGGVPASSPSNTATGHRRPSVSLPAPLMQRGLDRRRSAPRRPRPGTLDLSINRRGPVIELGLTGDLDMATAPRLREAMAWLRFSRGPAATIVIDTSDLDFIVAAGYRALLAALVGTGWSPGPPCRPHRGTGRREARGRDFGRVDPTSPAERASRLRARLTTAAKVRARTAFRPSWFASRGSWVRVPSSPPESPDHRLAAGPWPLVDRPAWPLRAHQERSVTHLHGHGRARATLRGSARGTGRRWLRQHPGLRCQAPSSRDDGTGW
jgi:hypothetical protein